MLSVLGDVGGVARKLRSNSATRPRVPVHTDMHTCKFSARVCLTACSCSDMRIGRSITVFVSVLVLSTFFFPAPLFLFFLSLLLSSKRSKSKSKRMTGRNLGLSVAIPKVCTSVARARMAGFHWRVRVHSCSLVQQCSMVLYSPSTLLSGFPLPPLPFL